MHFRWLLLIILCFLCTSHASAKTWYIKPDGTGDAPTIQAGVDSATAGDTVLVAPGIYSDTLNIFVGSELKTVNVFINKNILLIAEYSPDNTIIDASKSDVGIYTDNVDSTCVIKKLKIFSTNEGIGCILPSPSRELYQYPIEEPIGIQCKHSSINIIENVLIENWIAVKLNQRSNAKISNNTFNFNCVGIECNDSSNAIISNNSFSDGVEMVRCTSGSAPIIIENEIYPGNISCYGVRCINASPYIVRNKIVGMTNAAIICYESNPVIENNWTHCGWNGFEFHSCPAPIMRENIIIGSTVAMDLGGVTDGIIENNTIIDFGKAIYALGGSNPTIRNNIIIHGSAGIDCDMNSRPTFSCNDIYDVTHRYIGYCSDMTGISGNISVDPEFCGIEGSGNYYLQDDSPCAPGNHPDGYDCGLIGAFGVGCGIDPVTQKTWGIIKSLYEGTTLDTLHGEKQ